MASGPYLCIGLGTTVVCVGVGTLTTAQRQEALVKAEALAAVLGGSACLKDESCC